MRSVLINIMTLRYIILFATPRRLGAIVSLYNWDNILFNWSSEFFDHKKSFGYDDYYLHCIRFEKKTIGQQSCVRDVQNLKLANVCNIIYHNNIFNFVYIPTRIILKSFVVKLYILQYYVHINRRNSRRD